MKCPGHHIDTSALSPLGESSPTASDATVPWVLNQVLFPLILVLTFVALVKVVDYRRAWTELVETVRYSEPPLEREVVTMNLQLVKLLAALQAAEHETEEDFRLHLFEGRANRVHRQGPVLDDPEFQVLCMKTHGLHSPEGYAEQAKTIYIRCLEITEIGDETSARQVVRTENPETLELSAVSLASLDNNDYSEIIQANGARISSRNRRILQNTILDFLDGLKDRLRSLQEDLVSLMAQDLTRDPGSLRLPSEADELLRQMVLEVDPDSLRRLETEFYSLVVDSWRDELLSNGYDLVIWKELKAL